MTELVGQVRAALAARDGGRPERMGYFCAPFRPRSGPLSGKVLKPYRSGRDPEILEPLVRRHEAYLECLGRAGLVVPDTRLVLVHDHGVLRPVIVQDAAPPEAIAAHLVASASLEDALGVLGQVAGAVCSFWSGVAQRPERVGLHASIHTFALDAEAGPVFLETFPPLIGYSREDMGRLLSRFAESGLVRGIGAVLPGRVRELQDPWYTRPGNLGLLIEGAFRLRPQDQPDILDWAAGFVSSNLDASERSAVMTALARPRLRVRSASRFRRPRLPYRPHA